MAIHVNFQVVRLPPIKAAHVKIQSQKAGYHNQPQDLQV